MNFDKSLKNNKHFLKMQISANVNIRLRGTTKKLADG